MPVASAPRRPLVLEKWELLRHPLTRCAAAELFPVVGQVSLVKVAAHNGGLSQAARPAGTQVAAGLAEPHDPGGHLGGQAEFGADKLAQMAAAEPDLIGDAGDRDTAGAAGKLAPEGVDRCRVADVGCPPGQNGV